MIPSYVHSALIFTDCFVCAALSMQLPLTLSDGNSHVDASGTLWLSHLQLDRQHCVDYVTSVSLGIHDQLQLEWTLPRFREFGPSTGLQVGACTTGPVSMDNRDGVCIGANVWIAHPNQCKKLVK